ncbi:hypothetical protein [Rhizobium lusitanum]|uniref:hypothetical protein n=1 Tax=Rhizobium lusitanum TaxID=293958 RepID=UPI000B893616|nr:hypothetical protein [Rhizobium lusitanum]
MQRLWISAQFIWSRRHAAGCCWDAVDGKRDVPADPPGPFALVLSGDRAIAGGADDGEIAAPIVSRRHSSALMSSMEARASGRAANFDSWIGDQEESYDNADDDKCRIPRSMPTSVANARIADTY